MGESGPVGFVGYPLRNVGKNIVGRASLYHSCFNPQPISSKCGCTYRLSKILIAYCRSEGSPFCLSRGVRAAGCGGNVIHVFCQIPTRIGEVLLLWLVRW